MRREDVVVSRRRPAWGHDGLGARAVQALVATGDGAGPPARAVDDGAESRAPAAQSHVVVRAAGRAA